MNIEELRNYCLSKNGVEESFPFGPDTLVFKVGGKLFLLTGLDTNSLQFNAKCEPAKAIELREKYSAIIPGYHMNKKHWNSVICDGSMSKKLIFELIDDSYNLVINSLSKKMKESIEKLI